MLQLQPEDLRVAAYLGATEQIRTGTTTSLNHIVNVNDESTLEAIVEPVVEIGIRQLVAKEVRDTPDPPFSDRYPAYSARPVARRRAGPRRARRRPPGRAAASSTWARDRDGANWMLHNATSDEAHPRGRRVGEATQPQDHEPPRKGTPWLSIEGVLHDRRRRRGLPRAPGALTDNWVLIHCLWLEGDRARRPRGCERDHEPGQQRLQLRRHRAGEVDVPRGRERRPRQRRRLRELLDGHGRADEAALIQNVTHMDPTLDVRGAGHRDGDDQRREGARHRPPRQLLEVGNGRYRRLRPGEGARDGGQPPISALVFSAHGTDVDTVFVNGRKLLQGGSPWASTASRRF